jgi:hypothetical protein
MDELTYSQGMALVLIFCLAVGVAYLWWDSRSMRRRRRKLEAYRRYCEGIDAEARWIASNCFTSWRDHK